MLNLIQQSIDITINILVILLDFAHGYREQLHLQGLHKHSGRKKWGRGKGLWIQKTKAIFPSLIWLKLKKIIFPLFFKANSFTIVPDSFLSPLLLLPDHSSPLPLPTSLKFKPLFLYSLFLFSPIKTARSLKIKMPFPWSFFPSHL